MAGPEHEHAEHDWLFDELNAVVGVIPHRRIIDREEHAGDGLAAAKKLSGMRNFDSSPVWLNRNIRSQGASVHPGWFFDAHASLYNSTRFRPLRLA